MNRLAPVFTELDRDRLTTVIREARNSWRSFRPCLNSLHANLETARIVPPPEVPRYVITMNTVFDIQHVRDGAITRHTLVYPAAAPPNPGEMSILTPAGTAFLGAAVGDIVSWSDGENIGTAYVRSIIYQPEAAGRFDL